MALSEIHFNTTNALDKMTSAMVILPEGKPGPFPVLYLLHGLSDDHTAWTRRSNIDRYVAGLPLIVVMPNGERGFYTDARSNPKAAFETALVRDLIGFVDQTFQTIPTREGRVIAGLSMGGYGAMKMALKHPHLFCGASSLSGAAGFASRPLSPDDEWQREWVPVFGEDPAGGPDDCFALAQKADTAALPALRIDCGVDDHLVKDNRRFHELLETRNIPHEYVEYPGGHNWAYWNLHILDTLKFFCPLLGLPEFKPEDHL